MMATVVIALPQNVTSSPSQPRRPLSPRENPPQQTPVKIIRRKTSFVYRADSSEEAPSPHGSIYEALYISDRNSDEDGVQIEQWPVSTPDIDVVLPLIDMSGDENSGGAISLANRSDDAQFIYGRGTVLNTISEKPSTATIRTLGRPRSMDDLRGLHLISHRDNFEVAKSPRGKQSLSLDDLAEINGSYHAAIAMIELKACKPLPVREIYAEPKTPIHEPIQRPPTPPGMPSWTAHQNVPIRTHSRPTHVPNIQNRLQRFLGLPTFSSRRLIPSGTRSASAPARVTAPRYRAPRSGYGNIDHHPFNRAPTAKPNIPHTSESISRLQGPSPQTISRVPRSASKRKLLGKKVRFTPSTATSGFGVISPQATSASPGTPSSPSPLRSSAPVSPIQESCHHRVSRIVQKEPRLSTPLFSNGARIFPTTPSPATHPWRSRSPSRQELNPPVRPFDMESARSASGNSNLTLPRGTYELDSPTSSATQLLSTSPISPPPSLSHVRVQPSDCWRCKLDDISKTCKEKLGTWMRESSSCFFFVCCGYDCESESRPGSALDWDGSYLVTERPGRSPEDMGYRDQQGFSNSRRNILSSSPAVL